MHTLEKINNDYVEMQDKIDDLQTCYEIISSEKVKEDAVKEVLDQMKKMVSAIDGSEHKHILDTIEVSESYLLSGMMFQLR